MKKMISACFAIMVATSATAMEAIVEVKSLDYTINNTRTVTSAIQTENDLWKIEIAVHGVLLDSAEGEIRKSEFADTPFMEWVNNTNIITDLTLSITQCSQPEMTTISFSIPDSQRSRCLITFWTRLKSGVGANYYIPAGILLDKAKKKQETIREEREHKNGH